MTVLGLEGRTAPVCGNGEHYNLHLKSRDCTLPWQAYRATFVVGPDWQEIRIPFEHFTPNRLSAPLDTDQLTQLGLVAIGRAFRAQVCVAEVGWYRDLDAGSALSPSGCSPSADLKERSTASRSVSIM
ncbi:hypothetical protein ThidrDRAFT_1141 [Thiorhodococcus drewsii AZ1]|uniref:NADH:ubiquinone oxidoreductase intermediate-associated protein 30 domain-containing protein n=1 Tax=Thiorhodococcus drewsii AZ1 TaxID=765913 RepID=G2DYM9_9GAMM|nr:CIA30 family protein [Thiorhodococcus drewsii]EGV32656.1 hypothetical protein ThidrDRAFT_1141 [Thiorhodococcus drewsii AZ1]